MPSIKEASIPPANLKDMIPVTAPAMASKQPPPATSIPDYDPLSLGPPPPVLSTVPDGQRQWFRKGVSQYRISPLPSKANPSINASARSISTNVTNNIIQENIASGAIGPSGGGGGTDIDIIAALNSQPFGSLDTFTTTFFSTGNGGGNTITSTTITGNATGINELAIVTAVGSTNSGSAAGQNPGAGWAATPSQIGQFQKVISAAGSLTVGQNLGAGSYNVVQSLALLKTNGSTPGFTLRASQSGGTSLTSNPFTPAAGTSLLFTVVSSGLLIDPVPVITDSVGLTWQLLTNLYSATVTGGFLHNTSIIQYYAQNVPATSMTVTLNIGATGGSGTWTLHEISNVGNIASGAYTFQASDSQKLVQFSGGANITATLPGPALAAGWQVQVSNNGSGNVTFASTAFINNSLNGVMLGPGASTWVFSDGTNYWITTTASALNTPKVAHLWIDSYNPLTGVFGQSQPSVSDLSNTTTGSLGSIVLSNSPTLNTPTLLGATIVNATHFTNIIDKYNNIATVANGVPAEYALVANSTATANIGSTVLYAVPVGQMLRISYYVIVNRVATVSSTLPDLKFTWTDNDNSTVQTLGPFDSATPSDNTLTTMYSGDVIVVAKGGTNINYQTGATTAYASSGATAMQYSVQIRVEAI